MNELVEKILKMKLDYEKEVKENGENEKEVKENGKKIIKEILKEFFNENPDIKGIKWHQYTPYFNDGDACEFCICEIHKVLIEKEQIINLNDDDDDICEENSDYVWIRKYYFKENIREKIIKIDDIFSKLEDCLLNVFGDHAEVTATPEKITCNEFSHD